jgi:hypothetical protein
MKRLILAAAAIIAITASGAAAARVNVDISIGVPGVIYSEPDYYYPPVRYVERPRVVILPEHIYRPVPVYKSRFHRQEFRGHHHYKPYKPHHHKRHHRHHRGGWDR